MKATNAAEFIAELNAGVFASQIGHALSEVAAGVVDNKKVGTVTLTFTMKQIADSHQVTVSHQQRELIAFAAKMWVSAYPEQTDAEDAA